MHKFSFQIPFLALFICLLISKTDVQAGYIVGPGPSFAPIEVSTEFAGGTGTEDDPYLISDADQLELYRNYWGTHGSATNYFALTNDIYFNDNYNSYEKWGKTAPKHTLSAPNGYLNVSSFDGRGYTIYGIYSDGNSFLPSGMIESEIRNVNFSHFYCKNTPVLAMYFSGTYAGNINISNGIIKFDEPYERREYGGVFRAATAYLSDSQVLENINIDVKMTANQPGEIGLIAGNSSSTKIKNCSASGSLTYTQNDNSHSALGGLFGMCADLLGCTNNAEITISLPKLGNVVGDFGGVAGVILGRLKPTGNNEYSPVTVSDCKNTGSITVNTKYTLKYAKDNKLTRQYENTGGIIGRTQNGTTIKNCVNEGNIDVKFAYYTAGIVADHKGNINNCLNTGNITGDSCYSLSGIAGRTYGSITHCENRGNISSFEQMTDKKLFFVSANVAGIVSSLNSSKDGKNNQLKYCKNSGNLSASDESQWANVAGIAAEIVCDAYSENPTPVDLSYCYNTGNITGPFIGGIAANSSGTEGKKNTIKYCVNAGTIHQPYNDDRFAGIAFYINHTELSNCYNLGKLTSDFSKYRDRTGQIAGMNQNSSIVKKSYILNASANPIRGVGLTQTGGKASDIVRKSKATMLKYKTVKKIIDNAGYREP